MISLHSAKTIPRYNTMKHKQWLLKRNKPISRGTDNNSEGNFCLFSLVKLNTAIRSHKIFYRPVSRRSVIHLGTLEQVKPEKWNQQTKPKYDVRPWKEPWTHSNNMDFKNLRRLSATNVSINTEFCIRLSFLRIFHIGHVEQNSRRTFSLAWYEWFS